MPTGMPFRRPGVRHRDSTKAAAKLTEEPRHMPAKLNRIVATVARVRQRPEPVEPVCGAVAAHFAPRPPRRLRFGPVGIRDAGRLTTRRRRDECATRLACTGIQRQRPDGPTRRIPRPPHRGTTSNVHHLPPSRERPGRSLIREGANLPAPGSTRDRTRCLMPWFWRLARASRTVHSGPDGNEFRWYYKRTSPALRAERGDGESAALPRTRRTLPVVLGPSTLRVGATSLDGPPRGGQTALIRRVQLAELAVLSVVWRTTMSPTWPEARAAYG